QCGIKHDPSRQYFCPRALVVNSTSGDILRQAAVKSRRKFWQHTRSFANAVEISADPVTAMLISGLSGVAHSISSEHSFGTSARSSQPSFGTSACSFAPSSEISALPLVPPLALLLATPARSLAPWAVRKSPWFGQHPKWKAPDRKGRTGYK